MVVDLDNIPSNWEEVVKKIGLLKRNCFASVFEKYFEFQEQGKKFIYFFHLFFFVCLKTFFRGRGTQTGCNPLPR